MLTSKSFDRIGTVTSILALTGSMVGLGYYLFSVKHVIVSEVVLGVLGSLVGALVTSAAYWFSKKHERKKTSVFMSYSLKDRGIAERISMDLKSDGFKVLDVPSMTSVGESLDRVIEQTLPSADFFILLMSHNTAESPWIGKELDAALKNKVKILPVVTTEDAQIPDQISDLRFASIGDSYENAYADLKRAMVTTQRS